MRSICRIALVCLAALGMGPALAADAPAFQVKEGDYILRNFKFGSGEKLSELRIHYMTLGAPRRERGRIVNAVMILHGTGGTGQQFLRPQFADVLFAPGGLLDPAKYFIVLPDGIGHGKSSKPSDGLRAKFPHYDYDDMVAAQHALLSKGLGIDHLRLLFGTSMGCMHGFVWGETFPRFLDALMPMACLPVQIAGRNRVWRKMAMDAIQKDPAWQGGDYKEQPVAALRNAEHLLLMAGSAPMLWQRLYPTRDAADKYVDDTVDRAVAALDANDLLYQVNASRNYDPSGKLSKIVAPVMWINSADDFINPPELGIAEQKVKEVKNARFVLIPASEQTRGHGSHTWAVLWQDRLKELLDATEKR